MERQCFRTKSVLEGLKIVDSNQPIELIRVIWGVILKTPNKSSFEAPLEKKNQNLIIIGNNTTTNYS